MRAVGLAVIVVVDVDVRWSRDRHTYMSQAHKPTREVPDGQQWIARPTLVWHTLTIARMAAKATLVGTAATRGAASHRP